MKYNQITNEKFAMYGMWHQSQMKKLLNAVIIMGIVGGGCGGEKSMDKMSPKEVMQQYLKARKSGDKDTLQKLVYMPPYLPVEEKEKRVKSMIACGDEKGIMNAVSGTQKVEYEKIIDKDTAEVGVILFFGVGPLGKRIPFQQIMMKMDDGIWKLNYSKYSLTEQQLQEMIKQDPNDADAYYLLARRIQPENPAKAKRYFRKYYELAPDGFWIDGNMKEQFKGTGDYKKEEQKLLKELSSAPPAFIKDVFYRQLGQVVMEGGDYEKAKMYFQKAEEELKRDAKNNKNGMLDPLGSRRLSQARRELESLIKQREEDKTK